ncbi:MAG: hypothetical protein JW913_02400 [Chitinispirillaceae bacterium]|nr:hypothetical protein [Chitinispirillaceae bacterium]
MMNVRKQPLYHCVTAVLCSFLAMYLALNPEFFPVLLHEHIYHKSGSTITHIHTDFSLHVFFKHFCKTPGETGLTAREKVPIVTIAFYNTRHESDEVFCWAVFFFLLLIVIPYTRKRFTADAVARCARSPPPTR